MINEVFIKKMVMSKKYEMEALFSLLPKERQENLKKINAEVKNIIFSGIKDIVFSEDNSDKTCESEKKVNKISIK